jgi:hypothetical protein
MATRMQQRRGTAEQWTTANPTLAAGEIGFETDTSKFKIGNGSSAWSALTYFANAAELSAIIDNAPAALNTLNELAAAINDDANFYTNILSSIDSAVSGHNNATENVHGIASTTDLATLSDITDAIANVTGDYSQLAGTGLTWNEEADQLEVSTLIATAQSLTDHNTDTTDVHGIADTSLLATTANISTHAGVTTSVHGIADTSLLATTSDISTHNSDTTDVHGIANTANLATTSYVDSAETDAITAAGTAADTKISTAVAALTKSSVGLANVDNTSDSNKPVSTAQASAIATAKSEAIADATAQVNAVIASAPAALNTLDELAAALGDDANFASTVTTSLGLKAPLASPTFTGTVTVAAEGVAFTDGTQTKEGVPSRTPIVQKTASYALSTLTHRDSLIEVSSTSATTITIPLDSTVNYPIGTTIDILQTNTGQVTIAPVSGSVTVNATPGLKLRTRWSSATLMKRAANTWVVYGDLTA